METYHILEGHNVKKVRNVATWAKWFETADHHVALDRINDSTVSTIFLGLDHSFGGEKPLLFETMVFGGHWIENRNAIQHGMKLKQVIKNG